MFKLNLFLKIQKLIVASILCSISFINYGQNSTETFDGHEYALVNNHWFALYEGTLTKTENNIYVKSYSMTTQNISSIESENNVTFKKSFLTHFYIFKVDSNHNLIEKAKSIDSLPYTIYAELGVFGRYHSNPNDQYYPIGLGTGQRFLYSTGVGIGADSAWTITAGILILL